MFCFVALGACFARLRVHKPKSVCVYVCVCVYTAQSRRAAGSSVRACLPSSASAAYEGWRVQSIALVDMFVHTVLAHMSCS